MIGIFGVGAMAAIVVEAPDPMTVFLSTTDGFVAVVQVSAGSGMETDKLLFFALILFEMIELQIICNMAEQKMRKIRRFHLMISVKGDERNSLTPKMV